MVDQQFVDLLHYIKDKLVKSGASDAVVSGGKTSATQIKFVNNKVAKTGTEGMINIGIFFVKDKKIVTTSFKEIAELSGETHIETHTLNLVKNKIDKFVGKITKFSAAVAPKADYFGIAEGPFKYKAVPETFDSKLVALDEKKQIDIVESGINTALAEGAKRCGGIFETQYGESALVTSRNAVATGKGTSVYFSIRALLDKESSGHNTASERTLKNLDVEATAKFAGQIAALAKKPVPGDAGTYDVVFAPMAWGALLDRIGDSASIFDVEAGVSFFGNLLGKQIANPIVSIYDDATIAGGFGSTEFDSEGVPTRRTALVEKGLLKNYLHNTSTARKYKTETTANSGLISPHPWNIVLEKGKLSKDALFKDVKNGLYITNVWYTRFQNYSSGDFSTIPRDGIFVIKNGEISQPVKNLRVKENMLNLLKNLSALASDARQMTSWEIHTPVVTPHVLIKNVTVTKPTV